MNKLVYSPAAGQDLLDIKAYITDELANPSAAVRTVDHITKEIRTLTGRPNMGTPLSSVVEAETDYRFLMCDHYAAFYRFENQTVFIVRVLYGRRDFMRILFGVVPDGETTEDL